MMTVAELIERLKAMPQDAKVLSWLPGVLIDADLATDLTQNATLKEGDRGVWLSELEVPDKPDIDSLVNTVVGVHLSSRGKG